MADIPVRVYVPNSGAGTVSVIDPATFQVVDRFAVGRVPHHVTPSWDLSRLYVNNTEGNALTVIEPRSGQPMETIPITDPYNLYFTPDGSKAIVVAERYQRLDFYDPASWTLLKSVSIPWPGVDHGDFTADGRWFLASTEFSGQVVKVDTETMELAAHVTVGGLPIDVKVSPDGVGGLRDQPGPPRGVGDRPGVDDGDRVHRHRPGRPRAQREPGLEVAVREQPPRREHHRDRPGVPGGGGHVEGRGESRTCCRCRPTAASCGCRTATTGACR